MGEDRHGVLMRAITHVHTDTQKHTLQHAQTRHEHLPSGDSLRPLWYVPLELPLSRSSQCCPSQHMSQCFSEMEGSLMCILLALVRPTVRQ